MKRILIILIFWSISLISNAQAMTASYQAVNYIPTFITGGMTVRYEIGDANSYSGTTTVNDLMNNANASVVNAPTYNSAGTRYLNFNSASSNYILTGNIGASYNESAFMWIYPTGNGVILAELGQGAINTSYHDSNIEMVAGTLKFSIWNSSSITSTIATPLNYWYYVGFTYDGTTLTAYVNGQVAGSTTVTRSPPGNLYYGIGAADATNMGNGGYGNFRLNAFHYYKRALSLNEIKLNYVTSKYAPNGLTANNASSSAYQIKQDFPNSTDGFYWIKSPNINSGTPFQIYADMTRSGGGWTLIMKNSNRANWTYASAIATNTTIPYTTNADITNTATANYSIIGLADNIKRSASGFQYMIDATTRGSFGGIWTANGNYSFIKTNNTQTNITLDVKFGNWNYVTEDGLSQRMPWYSNTSGGGYGLITTDDGSGNWWGTLIAAGACNCFVPTPWIQDAGGGTANTDPGIIWYWVR